MRRRFTSNFWLSVFVLFFGIVPVLVSTNTTKAVTSTTPWLDTSAQPTLKQEKVLAQSDVFPTVGGQGNVDCKNETVITRPAKPLIGGQQTATACFVQTLFGNANSNGLVRINNTSVAGSLVNYSGAGYKPGFIAIPNSQDIINFTTGPVTGLFLHFTHSLLSHVAVETSLAGDITYRVHSPADASLRDKDGHLLAAQTDSLSFSSSGEWMVVDSPPYSLLRVNTKTLDVLPFANLFNYNIGSAPLPKTAVSNDGRYVAIASFDFSQFRLYDLSTCDTNVPTTITGPVTNCRFFDAYSFLKQKIPGFLGVSNIRFLSNDTFTFIASYKNAQNVNERAFYSLTAPGANTTQLQYLGMGDSFASGEGAFAYQDGTDTDNNKCHLSERSYPNLIKSELGYDSAHSVACSGAVINDVISGADSYRGQVHDDIQKRNRNTEPILANFVPGYLPQLDFTAQYRPNITTVSMGGNDIGFVDKLKRCFEVDTCFSSYEDRLEIVREINNRFDDLVDMYQKLKTPNPSAKVYVIGYPQVAEVGGNCGSNVHLNAEEIDFAHQLIDYLNFVIKRASDNAGVRYVDVGNAFSGQMLCDPVFNKAVNGLTIGNDIPDILNVSIIGDESFHPNDRGHQLLKQTILGQTQNLTQSMPAPDITATRPDDTPNITFLNVAHTNRPVYSENYDEDLANDVIIRGGVWGITVDGLKFGLKAAQTGFHLILNSEPIDLGTFATDSSGNLSASFTIPTTVPAGFHTLHLQGNNIAGEPVDIYKTIYVAASQDDLDGDGVPNTTDTCTGFAPSGQDTDIDGIDDACDPNIGEPPSPPTASFTAPNANATIGGTTQLVVSAQDQRGVAGVQFKLDGNDFGSEDTTDPFTYDLDTTDLSNGEHTLSASVRNIVGLETTIEETITVYNNTPPKVTITAPLSNITVGGVVQITAEATDNKSVQSLQFQIDGQNVGSQLSEPPYVFNWDTHTIANGEQTITTIALDDEGLSSSSTLTVAVYNLPPPPTVTITAPSQNATLSGTVVINVSATDAEGVAGVQFKLDDQNLGPEQTTGPYSYSLDTKTVTNGLHTIRTVARSINGQTTTASTTVNVQNLVTPSPTNPLIKLIQTVINLVVKIVTTILKLFR